MLSSDFFLLKHWQFGWIERTEVGAVARRAVVASHLS